ncbi:RHS repeat protein, partial [Enterobacter chengduensis]|nr:RHS repeat protein [Enterobacter chengduensis]MDI6558976.1 RHS repeat protein [Enterobacter chengduensis]
MLPITCSEYDRLGRLYRRDDFTGNAQRPSPRRWSRRWDAAGNPLEGSAEKVTHNRLTQLNGIRWRYD